MLLKKDLIPYWKQFNLIQYHIALLTLGCKVLSVCQQHDVTEKKYLCTVTAEGRDDLFGFYSLVVVFCVFEKKFWSIS